MYLSIFEMKYFYFFCKIFISLIIEQKLYQLLC